jgi:hypothetical protein
LHRRSGDELAGHLIGVAAREAPQDRMLVLASLLAAHPIDRATRATCSQQPWLPQPQSGPRVRR